MLSDVLLGSALAGLVTWPTLDLLWRLLSLPQRSSGVGIYRPVNERYGRR